MSVSVDLSRDVNEIAPGVIALRRELHRHPELAFEEVWTAATPTSTGWAWTTPRAASTPRGSRTGAMPAPGCFMLLGTANADKGITEIWHRPGFDVDEEALALAALDLLR